MFPSRARVGSHFLLKTTSRIPKRNLCYRGRRNSHFAFSITDEQLVALDVTKQLIVSIATCAELRMSTENKKKIPVFLTPLGIWHHSSASVAEFEII